MSSDVMVQIALDDLCNIKTGADCSPIFKQERDELQKRLNVECKEHAEAAAENAELKRRVNDLKSELAKLTNQRPNNLQPVTVTAISNAKDVLRALYRPISSEENLPNETVPADRFQTVYHTLRDLVSRLEQEGLA